MPAPASRGPRLRELGLRIGEFGCGEHDAITDVAGVRVGHVTVWRDEPDGRGIARTGVTAIVPGDRLFAEPAQAGAAVLNGAGELTGFVAVSEWGVVESPVYLTSTMAVGRVFDGAVAAAIAEDAAVGREDVLIPVVAECDDSWLSDVQQVEAADAGRALAAARGGVVAEGAVGAGTGMICFDWKGGIGTASRIVPDARATVGVLVLANYGDARDLRIDGVPVGRMLAPGDDAPRVGSAGADASPGGAALHAGRAGTDASPGGDARRRAGSCIAVLATDAPLAHHQLTRLARRAGLGLGRTGSVAHHGSGEIFLAFSTSGRVPRDRVGRRDASFADAALDPLFAAAVDATEEAVLNALWAAPDVSGRDGRTARGLPHEPVRTLLREQGRVP